MWVGIQWPSRFLPSVTASQAALFCEGWISRNVFCTLALMGPFLLLAGELKRKFGTKPLNPLSL
jgi:hypothetical protein